VIPLLGPGHHRYVISRVDGFSSCLHQASIVDDDGRSHVAFVKAFPSGSKGLANEACGWLLARAAGLPTAESAWILILPVALLREAFPELVWPGRDDDYLPTWATSAVSPTAAECVVTVQDQDVWAERLLAWGHLHDAVAINDLLHNIDANAGNLIATSPSDFAIVDFAEILGGQNWTAKSLQKLGYLHNKLCHLAWGNLPSPQDAQAIGQSTRKLAAAWPTVRHVVANWWDELLGSRKDIEAGLAFIDSRANNNN